MGLGEGLKKVTETGVETVYQTLEGPAEKEPGQDKETKEKSNENTEELVLPSQV